MPMHDWTRVDAGIFHAFHHDWITQLARSLNAKLPGNYYALPEQVAAGFGPDVLMLHADVPGDDGLESHGGVATAVQAQPTTRFRYETSAEFFQRKKSSIAIRHVSGDRIVAFVEVVSPGNKSTNHAFDSFIKKACELLEHRIHLLLLDPFPPGPRDPNGIHAAIWERYNDEPFELPSDAPLTFAAYECDLTTRAYIEPLAVGSDLPAMPLFLAAHAHIPVALEETYNEAFAALPQRWSRVLEA